jgi:hypothetical protein
VPPGGRASQPARPAGHAPAQARPQSRPPARPKTQRAAAYIESVIPELRRIIQKAEQPAKKKKGGARPLQGLAALGPCWGRAGGVLGAAGLGWAGLCWGLLQESLASCSGRLASRGPRPSPRARAHTCTRPAPRAGEEPPAVKITRGELFVADRFIGWQEAALLALQGQFDAAAGTFPKDAPAAALAAIQADPSVAGTPDKALKQLAMPFVKFMMEGAAKGGAQVGS